MLISQPTFSERWRKEKQTERTGHETSKLTAPERAVLEAAKALVSKWRDEAGGDAQYLELECDANLIAAVEALNEENPPAAN